MLSFFIKKIRINLNNAVVEFEDFNSIEKSQKLLKSSLYLPIDMLPKLKGKKFYFHEVINFKVIDKEKGFIGNIVSIIDNPNNPLFLIMFEGKEILIPLNDKFIQKVDRDNQTIEIEAPEGLIDIYLE